MLHYTTSGNGYPLVLLHGFCEDSRIWNKLVPLLSEKYKVICIDLPGFGLSPLAIADLSIWADLVNEIFEQEKLQGATLIGHSMGGYVTLAFAEKYMGKLVGFGLFHSSAAADDEAKKESREKNIAFVQKNGVKAFVKQLIPGLFAPEANEEIISDALKIAEDCSADGIVAALTAMKNRPERTHVLRNSNHPVLFISGEKDPVIPTEKTTEQAAMVKTAQFSLLKNSGHMGMMEETAKSLEILSSFLELANG